MLTRIYVFFQRNLMHLINIVIWFSAFGGAAAAIYKFVAWIVRHWKISKPKFELEFMRGGATFVRINNMWFIRYLGFKVRVPPGRPSLSIETVEYPIRDRQSGEFKNQPCHEGYLYLFPLRGSTEKDWELVREFLPNKTYSCCIPQISTGIFEDGEYELILRIRCTAIAGEKSIERNLPIIFTIKGENVRLEYE